MNIWRDAVLRPVLLVIVLGLMVVCAKVALGWWKGELVLTEDGNWVWFLLFPILLIVWWRYFSIFGCTAPACMLPEDEKRK